MDIKNFLHQKKENKKKKMMLSSVLIFMSVLLLLLLFFINKDQKKITYTIWDKVEILGKITYDNNFPINTHKISNEKSVFGLKSSSMNLNNFVNKVVLLNGEINYTSSKHPISQIDNIKIPESKLIINENKYFFTNELISFDFSKDIDLKAERTWRNITIYYQNEPVLFVETFMCSKVIPTQNCEEMKWHYDTNFNEIFTTYFGYVFYKNKENSRVTFNDNTIWYIFKTNDNNFLLNISHLINIINSKFITENKKDLIFNSCNNTGWLSMKKINKISKEIIDETLTKVEIQWLDDEQNPITCKLTIDIRDNREVKTSNISS